MMTGLALVLIIGGVCLIVGCLIVVRNVKVKNENHKNLLKRLRMVKNRVINTS